MFFLWPLVASAAAAGGQPETPPASLCGGADVSRAGVKMTLRFMNGPAGLPSPDVHVTARNGDGSYSLSVGYRPTAEGLGKPHIVHVDALAAFPSEADARPLRIEWREPSKAWYNPVSWTTPQRFFPKEEPRFKANYRMGQGAPFPHDTDVLEALARGVTYEFRNVDEAGTIVSTGVASYPPQRVLDGIYAEARSQALSRLRPCSTGKVAAPPVRAAR